MAVSGFDLLGGGVKSIQHLTVVLTANETIVPIEPIDSAKSIVMLSLRQRSTVSEANRMLVRADVTDNTLILNMGTSVTSPTVYAQIVEFNLGKPIQRGTYTTNVPTDSITIEAVNLDKAVLFFTHSTSNTSTSSSNAYIGLNLSNETTISINQVTSVNRTINWQVVEFD